jgi:UDP-N-acetylenolpyruvoylglucosamine reductase
VDVYDGLVSALRGTSGVRLWAEAPLAPFTTIATGGKARLLVTVADVPALVRVLAALDERRVDWFCLGAGSNLLVADQGYDGVVIKLDQSFQYVEGLPVGADRPSAGPSSFPAASADPSSDSSPDSPVVLTVGAGAYLARLAAVVAEAGLTGMEHACGIPGSVGGAVAMNAGAYGWCMRDVVHEVEIATASGWRWVVAADLEWGYRYCRLPARSVVTAVRIVLRKGDRETCLACQRAYLRQRREKQPRSVRTFGSAFKNPPGLHAGRLVEAAGLKGLRRGGAEISNVHGNFLVNVENATTADVLALMSVMRQAVERTSGVVLEPEVKLVGCRFPWETADSDDSRSSVTGGPPGQGHG